MLKKPQIAQDYPTTESQTPPSHQHRQNNHPHHYNAQMIQKIIASNEDLIQQQMLTIRELKKQNMQQEQYIKQLTIKYNQLLLFATQSSSSSNAYIEPSTNSKKQPQLHQNSPQTNTFIIEHMLQKIAQLEHQLSITKVELAMKSAEILSHSLRKSSISEISSHRRKTETLSNLKTNLEAYFQPQPLDRTSSYHSKKNSIDSKENIESWNKLVDLYCKGQAKTLKLKDKSQSLIKRFIPKQLRSVVWNSLIENRLGMTNALYIELLERREMKWVGEKVSAQIEKDIKRSFYGKTQYQTQNSIIFEVSEFLEIFHVFRPDVSYVQGMTYPAIILIPILGKVRAFNLFCNLLLGNPFLRRTFTLEENFVETVCRAFELLLLDYQPQVYEKMQQEGIQSEIFLIEWLFTFFSRGFHYETTLKFWDQLLFYEEVAFFRMGLSIFQQLGPLILQRNYEDSINIIRDFGKNVDQDKLLEGLSSSKLTNEKLSKALDKAISLSN